MSRLQRLTRRPIDTLLNSVVMRTLGGLFFLGMSFHKEAKTFFGEHMTVPIPSGYGDVYLYGATVDADAEVRLNRFLLRELAEGGTFFDVGACLGYYSLLASTLVGPGGGVHAFEPAPPLLPLLRRNLGDKSNVRIVNKAASKAPGSARFYVAPLPFVGCSSMRADWMKQKTELVTVETICLDDYCYSTGLFPDMIKLDVEGVEENVLRGSERLLRERAPLLILEVFMPLIESDRESLRMLKELDYEPYAIQEDGRLRALNYASVDSHLADLKTRYRIVQDSINDFDNMVFKRSATGGGARRLLS